MQKTAIVIGATGLVGTQLVTQLLASPHYERVRLLSRRAIALEHPKLEQKIIDFDHPDADLLRGDDFFCCMGTTLKKAGSQAAQYKIDCEIPAALGSLARKMGVKRYLLVSSVGADAGSSNFYLRTKGELENKIKALGFECFVALRPSFLLGNREENRLGERIGIVVANALSPLMVGGLRKYRGVQAEKVAQTLIQAANSGLKGDYLVDVTRWEKFKVS